MLCVRKTSRSLCGIILGAIFFQFGVLFVEIFNGSRVHTYILIEQKRDKNQNIVKLNLPMHAHYWHIEFFSGNELHFPTVCTNTEGLQGCVLGFSPLSI